MKMSKCSCGGTPKYRKWKYTQRITCKDCGAECKSMHATKEGTVSIWNAINAEGNTRQAQFMEGVKLVDDGVLTEVSMSETFRLEDFFND